MSTPIPTDVQYGEKPATLTLTFETPVDRDIAFRAFYDQIDQGSVTQESTTQTDPRVYVVRNVNGHLLNELHWPTQNWSKVKQWNRDEASEFVQKWPGCTLHRLDFMTTPVIVL